MKIYVVYRVDNILGECDQKYFINPAIAEKYIADSAVFLYCDEVQTEDEL